MKQPYGNRGGDNTETMLLWIFALVVVAAFAWLGWVDKNIDNDENATLHDRIRVHCQTFPHDALCLTIRKENE